MNLCNNNLFESTGHKGDQTGEDRYGKHLYCNIVEPSICPVLALAVLIFTRGYVSGNDKPQLFNGTNSKDRFSHLLSETLSLLSAEELQIMSNDVDDIGTHSLRKGAATYCLGQVMGPSPVTVYIRMGHCRVKLKDKYIFFGEGADQLCGRTLCGLPYSDDRFCLLPLHFENEILAELTEQYWQEIVQAFVTIQKVSKHFHFCLLPFCITLVT